MPSMTANDSTPSEGKEPSDSAEQKDWEATAKRHLARLLFEHQSRIDEAAGTLYDRLMENDEITRSDVRKARNALYEIEWLIEQDIVPDIEGAEPFEQSTQNLTHEHIEDALARMDARVVYATEDDNSGGE